MSQYDDGAERELVPDQQHDDAPDSSEEGDPDVGDTQPLGARGSFSLAGERPGPYPQPFGRPSADGPDVGSRDPYVHQPYGHDHDEQPPYGARPYFQDVHNHYTADPYGRPTAPYPTQQPVAGSRAPGWMWPVVAGVALLVGLLGGVVGGVAVSSSMSSGTAPSIPVIDTDNGAAAPLDPDNGSVAAVAAKLLPSTVQIQAKGGADGSLDGGATGSGFVLDDKDHVITNNHVVADATGKGEIKVVDQVGRDHDARIIGRSPVYDIAVLEVTDTHSLRPAAIGSSRRMHVGDTVVAIGSPLGLRSTVTSGIVSALDRPVTTGDQKQSSFINAVQTDAAINPGNSGGPLVNLRGQVVGVNSAIATTGGIIGESGNIGVGFAIPMEQVRITASQILATGEARYPVIGANVNTGDRTEGAEVVEVPSGTPAAAAGLREGDVVISVNGKQITDGISLIVAIRSHQPGETITLRVQRDGRDRQVRITLDGKVG